MATVAQTTRPAAPAPKPAPPTPAPATSTPARATGGPPAVRLGGAAPAGEVAPGVLELKGMSEFKPPAPIAEFLDSHKKATVNARFDTLAQGPLEVRTAGKGKYRIRKQPLPITHPAFARVAEFAPGLAPALIVHVDDTKVAGEVGLAAGVKIESIAHHIQKAPAILGLAGFSIKSMPGVINKLEGGSLHLGLTGVPITLGSAFSGTFSFEVIDTSVTFDGKATVAVKGLANGTLELKRTADGLITGKAAIDLTLPKNFSGSVDVAWDGVSITGVGKVGYQGEKFSGFVTLYLMEKNAALELAKAKKAPEGAAPQPAAAAVAKKPPTKIDYVVFGEGDLAFSFTDWLNGTAHVIVDPKGNVTVIGEIRPQKEFNLFKPPQREYVKQLFKIEARATYGLPVVGNLFIFCNASMDLFAILGPAKFYNIIVKGTYSTDPTVAKDFSIQGSLNLSAAAGARLRAEAGFGIEILSHDIKAGAGIQGVAGIKAYAEATPIIGYREKAAEGEDLKGEWFIRGELEVAAQPFLGLSGDLFVELETPWWSPLSDDKWTWPLFNKEWPLGGTMGMLVSVDYVFGSGQWPKFDLKPVEFNSEKFMSSMYDDQAKSGPGKEVEQKGKWGEKNSAAAQPPPKTSPPGNIKPGKAGALPAAKAKPVTSKKSGKPADPNARTKEGKSVKQLQDEAAKKGKKPDGKAVGKGAKTDTTKKDTGKEAHDEELRKGLAALEAVTVRYAKDGATKEEVIGGVKSVRRKFTVFKTIEVIDGGSSWDYDYAASPGTKKKGPPKAVPATHVDFKPQGRKGKYVKADPLTSRPGNTKGSSSTSARIPADPRISALNKISVNWVKMHLLHSDLHGPNEFRNFTPGTQKSNDLMNVVEADVIKQIRAGKIYSYTVDVTYRTDEDDSDFPEEVMITYGFYDDGGKLSTKSKPVPVPPPGQGISVASLSYDGRKRLRDIGGLRPRFAVAIAETQKRRGYVPFKTHEDVVEAIIFSQTLAAPSEEITLNIEDSIRKGKLTL